MHVYKCKDVYVCMYVLVCNYVSVCVYLYVGRECMCVGCVLQYSDPFVRSELDNRIFGLVYIVDPIHWRFKNRPTS